MNIIFAEGPEAAAQKSMIPNYSIRHVDFFQDFCCLKSTDIDDTGWPTVGTHPGPHTLTRANSSSESSIGDEEPTIMGPVLVNVGKNQPLLKD